jgi:hypothetical protein
MLGLLLAITLQVSSSPIGATPAAAAGLRASAAPAPDVTQAPAPSGAVVALGRRAPLTEVFAPGTRYDTAIPTLQQVVGHEWGEQITTVEAIATYLKALHGAAPDRTRLVEYAKSWEGRPLYVLVIGSREQIARLDQTKAEMKRLADPRGLPAAEGDRLVRNLPAVVWLAHAVHGNEISSPDAALMEAYHLLAAQDPAVAAMLNGTVVLIDPLQNPDGRARFVLHNQQAQAAVPDPEPYAAEHDEPWPGGRSNHYLFDMNRDWFVQSQPESRGRARLFLDWFPQVVVDLHEMGGNSTYYFAPPADPLNPFITKAQNGWFTTFGRENARAFDARGFAHFSREVFDSFYPGYGESWPLFHGAIGMTYEMASSRGLVFRRSDDTLLHFRDGVLQHFTAAITTLSTAAANRERLLRDFLEYRQSAIADGERGTVREYAIPPGPDPSRSAMLAALLVRQGIDVRRTTETATVAGRTLPAGTHLVSLAQPLGRLIRNLMDPHVPQPEAFVKEQERRRQKRLGDQIYDITAWSLPLAFDVEVVPVASPVQAQTRPLTLAEVERVGQAPAQPLAPARVGYLLPWGSGTAALATDALRQGLKVRTVGLGFTLGGRKYPAGTALIRTSENPADLPARLGALASAHGVEAVPIDSAFVEQGTSLGSNDVAALKAPRVLLLWDVPTQSTSAGWTRFVLERRMGQALTAVRGSSFGRADLERFDVVVLPAGNYTSVLGGDTLRRLKDWVSRGGTVITLGEASRWAARENVGLLDTRTELRDGRPEVDPAEKDQKKAEAPPKPFDYEKAIQPDRERPEVTPGALLRVTLDLEHWLSAGTDGEVQTIVEGQRVFRPITADKGRNVGVYQVKDKLVAGGLAWPDAQDLLAQKAWLIHQPLGSGHVIAFAEDPNYRVFAEATQLLFANAVLLGPAH